MAARAVAAAAANPTAARTRVNPLGAAAAGALAADDIDVYEINRDHVLADALKCTQIRRPALG